MVINPTTSSRTAADLVTGRAGTSNPEDAGHVQCTPHPEMAMTNPKPVVVHMHWAPKRDTSACGAVKHVSTDRARVTCPRCRRVMQRTPNPEVAMEQLANWPAGHTTDGETCNRREREDGKSLIDSACGKCREELRTGRRGVAGYYGGERIS